MNNLSDALAQFLRQNPDLPQGEDAIEAAPAEASPRSHPALTVSMERKGRGGKTATIISGFTLAGDDKIAGIASRLKSRLGTGGSARGGEILIQGDRRDDVAAWLRAQGYKVKGVK